MGVLRLLPVLTLEKYFLLSLSTICKTGGFEKEQNTFSQIKILLLLF